VVEVPDIRLRPEVPSDFAFLQRLYIWLHWADLDALAWTADHKTAYLLSQFGQHMAHLAQNHADGDYRLIILGDEPIGRFYVDSVPSEIRLLALDLLPDFRGQGIGGKLLADLTDQAKASNRKITTQVDATGPALSWFERKGFRRFTRLGHYCGLELAPC
jgi:GNAT superfamily N-acetyltransferase